MGYVELMGLSFAHANGRALFTDVDLRLERGWTALVGENGAGKSTLLRLIAGELRVDAGRVHVVPSDAVVQVVRQDVDEPSSEVLIFVERVDGEALRLRAELALDADAICRWHTLSPGERRRFQLAAALSAAPDVLLLDEPTNHLDVEMRSMCIAALRRFRGVGLLVSHDRELIDELARCTLRLYRGRLSGYEGGYSAAREAWESERSASVVERERRRREVDKMMRRLADARRTQASAEHARSSRSRMRDAHDHDARSIGAKTLAAWAEARASRSVAVLRREVDRAQAQLAQTRVDKAHGRRIHAAFERCPRSHVAALHVSELGYPGHPVLRNLSIVLRRDARVRIEGPNGAGKSTLLRALARAVPDPERVLHLPQELTEAESARLLDQTRALPRALKARVLDALAALGVDPDELLASRRPSLGETRKLALAHGLGRGAWALLLDEPQNHLDLPSLERLEAALCAYPGALAVVTHDPRFAARSLHETWRIEHHQLVCCATAPWPEV